MVDVNPEFKKRILEVFVTSAEDPIYAVRSTVPPEMFGAFGSYFSRNPKDFREHLWGALTGQIEEERGDVDIERELSWLVDPSLRQVSDAIKAGVARSQDFFRRWYGKYSHKSIANTVWLPLVATRVSQLFARELAYDQLAFFIEQSTRYVRFDPEEMFRDADVMASRHAEAYEGAVTTLARAYISLTDAAVAHYKRQIPFDKWLEVQPDSVRTKKEKFQRADYDRQVRGKALDVSRFLLPQAARTNIAWILDARSTESDIAAWKGHPIKEMREAAELIEKHAGELAPSLLNHTERNDYYGDKLRDYGGALGFVHDTVQFSKGVHVVHYDPDGLDNFVAHVLKRHNRGGTFEQRARQVKEMSFAEKMEVLRRIVANRNTKIAGFDEWLSMGEEADLVPVTIAVRTDIGAIRDWRRHQKWDRSEALYTLDNGVHRPPMLDEMPADTQRIFDDAILVAHNAERQIRRDFPHQAQYVVPMAAMHEITMRGGLDQLQYMLWTRTTPEGNWSYRKDAFNIAEAAVRAMPWLLGYERCPEGKPFLQVYEEAPLKGFLCLRTEETGLHT
ncbi:MAG: FAD-dependent thymidylate synthase [Candidatus Woesearchaeota archaeon]|nr:MAG: FAD-dependent thymidylate synthase [Candidatus Woesearchaeota archaeon]